jgi:hypothetical protein
MKEQLTPALATAAPELLDFAERVKQLICQANDPDWASDILDALCCLEPELDALLAAAKGGAR